jgi:uncharacterized protein YkwD
MLRAFAVSLATLALIVASGASGVYAAESTSSAASAQIIISSQPTPNNFGKAPPTDTEDAVAEAALFESLNLSRQQAGVPPMRMEESLREAARLHAERMVSTQHLEHQFPGEPSLLQRIADVSSLPLDRAGENLANASCPDGAHDVLMRSPLHRKNLLDPHFNVAGIAAVWSRGRLYVVQDFGHITTSYSAKQTGALVRRSISEARQGSSLSNLEQVAAPHLDEAACTLATQNHPNARLIAASYTNRKIITYTQSRPEVLPPGAVRLLGNPNLRQFAVGSCYARNAAYPTGIYWVAILLN